MEDDWGWDNPYDIYDPGEEQYENPPPTPNYDPQPPPLIDQRSHSEDPNTYTISFVPMQTAVSEIRKFVNENPYSYLVIPTSETGLLRLSKETSRGYKVAMIKSLRDILK